MEQYKNLYSVWGNPIEHSLSPVIHSLFAQQFNIEIDYRKMIADIEGDDFEQALQLFFKFGGKGCNITAPFKERAFKLLNSKSTHCENLQSCNTIKLLDDNSLYGDNTDGYGLYKAVTDLNWFNKDSKVLIIGAGGAVAGFITNLLTNLESKSLTIVNRSPLRVKELQKRFIKYGTIDYISLDQFDYDFTKYDLIINSVSIFTIDNNSKIKEHSNFYDINYKLNYPTAFLESINKNIEHNGLNNVGYQDGLSMLINQAAKSFELWFGKTPNLDGVYETIKEQFMLR